MKRAVVFLLFLLFCPSSLPAQSPKHLLLGLASISGGIDVLYVTKKPARSSAMVWMLISSFSRVEARRFRCCSRET